MCALKEQPRRLWPFTARRMVTNDSGQRELLCSEERAEFMELAQYSELLSTVVLQADEFRRIVVDAMGWESH